MTIGHKTFKASRTWQPNNSHCFDFSPLKISEAYKSLDWLNCSFLLLSPPWLLALFIYSANFLLAPMNLEVLMYECLSLPSPSIEKEAYFSMILSLLPHPSLRKEQAYYTLALKSHSGFIRAFSNTGNHAEIKNIAFWWSHQIESKWSIPIILIGSPPFTLVMSSEPCYQPSHVKNRRNNWFAIPAFKLANRFPNKQLWR